MISAEATKTNFIVFGLTWPGLEPTIYRIRGEHANHYTTDAVEVSLNPAHGEVYSIQHYGIKFVSDLSQVDGFFSGFSISATNKKIATI